MFKEFWKDMLLNTTASNGHIVGDCPICGESKRHFYANILTGCWDCKKCQVSGNAWTYLRDYKQMGNDQIFQHFEKYGISRDQQKEEPDIPKPKIFSIKAVEYFCSRLSEETISEFAIERGLSIEILRKYRIGINDVDEFTLPVVDEFGDIRNILRKRAGGSTISSKDGDAVLFGIDDLIFDAKEIFIVEGPWSTLALKERGYKAVGTCGAGILKDEQVSLFKDKEVFFIPDNDVAGKKGIEKIAQKLKTIAKHIYVIKLPVSEQKDIRDFFKDGGTTEQFEKLIKQAVSPPENIIPLSLPEFLKLDFPPVEFHVVDIIQKKGKAMVSAAPNIGKSIFVQNMALDIACGSESFMDKFAVSSAKVLYLDLEMGDSALKERFQKMSSLRSENIKNLFVQYIPVLDLLAEDGKKLIESWLEALKVDVLILDPLGNAWSGDESKQEQVGQLTAYLNELIAKFNISILVVHHWRKATKDFKTGGQMAAGSYKWSAWLDCHVTLEGNSSSITVSSHKNRNRLKFNPFMVKLNPDTLGFEFVADYEKKYDESTLEHLFNQFNRDRVSVPELIKCAKEHKACSETTLRDLIGESKLFTVDKSGKTHHLVRKADENITNISWDE